MSHHIHKTDAIVLSIETKGEQNIGAILLTRDLGLIRITVVSGRMIQNKHRAHLVRFARVHVDMVSGVSGWRLTGISDRAPFRHIARDRAYSIYSKAARLILKLTGENELQEELYTFFDALIDTREIALQDSEHLKGFEIYVVMKILAILGYWETDDQLVLNIETLRVFASSYASHVRAINQALESTHLISK